MDWDEQGEVTLLGLSGRDEKIYRLVGKENQRELLQLIRKEVEIRGVVKEQATRPTVIVSEFVQMGGSGYTSPSRGEKGTEGPEGDQKGGEET